MPDPSLTDDRISDADDPTETWSHAERITLARSFLTDELPITDSAAAIVPRLSALAQADYVVPVTTQPGFPLSSAMVNHFHQIHCDLQPPPVGKSQRFATVPRSRDTLYAPEVLSSGHFPFSRESPVVDRGFADISRSTAGRVTQHRLSPEQRYLRDLAVTSRRRICITSFQDWSGAALNRSIQGMIDHFGAGTASAESILCHGIQHPVASA